MWQAQENAEIPFVGMRDLVLMKMTQREKDYPIIGELARRLPEVPDQLRFSRSARDLLQIARQFRQEAERVVELRPLISLAIDGETERLAEALDAERRQLMRADEERLFRYQDAAQAWAAAWPDVEERAAGLPLESAHAIVCAEAESRLPFAP